MYNDILVTISGPSRRHSYEHRMHSLVDYEEYGRLMMITLFSWLLRACYDFRGSRKQRVFALISSLPEQFWRKHRSSHILKRCSEGLGWSRLVLGSRRLAATLRRLRFEGKYGEINNRRSRTSRKACSQSGTESAGRQILD